MSYQKELFRLELPHGDGDLYFEWQPGSGSYLATTGSDYSIGIFTRQGKLHQHLRLAGQCTGFGWDSDGDILGVISNGSTSVLLWDSNTGKTHTIDTGLADGLCVITWAVGEPTLAVAGTRGNIAIYNHLTSKRIPVVGKHSKRIVSGCWGKAGLLALCSEDRTVSISNSEGDTLRSVQLRGDPSTVRFGVSTHSSKMAHDTIVSVVVNKRALFLYNLQDPDNPVELNFQGRYGNIVAYEWYGDGFVLVGFSTGCLVSISTDLRELGREQFQIRDHHSTLSSLAISSTISKVATCGDNVVKVVELSKLSDVCGVITLPEGAAIERLGYSPDGQLLTLVDSLGSLSVHLTHLSRLSAASANVVALLSSLSQVTVYLVKGKAVRGASVDTQIEPSLVGVGPFHLVIGLNNRSFVYDIVGDVGSGGPLRQLASVPVLLGDREYISTVQSFSLNAEYTSALLSNRIHLQLTESVSNFSPRDKEEKELKIFPEPGEQMNILCHALTTDFLVYASDAGDIRIFALEDWVQVCEYKHTEGIRALYPDSTAARIIIVDNNSYGFLYSPVDDMMIQLTDFPVSCTGVLWDLTPSDRNIFIVFDSQTIVTYLHVRFSIDGSRVERVGETKLLADQIPMVLQGGLVNVATSHGKITNLTLSTHTTPSPLVNSDSLPTTLDKHIALNRYTDAWNTCLVINEKQSWLKLADSCLKNLNLETAIRVYSHLGDAAIVMSLEKLLDVENKKLLAGHISELLGEFDKAQSLYLESSEAENALVMRQRLLQWDQALQLANNLAPQQIPYTAVEYALQLELTGQYSEALVHFEKAVLGSEGDLKTKAVSGLARTSLRVGDYRRGIAIANESNSKSLLLQCAEILESVKKLSEAATLYEKAEEFNKAAAAYVSLKNWRKIGSLLPKVTNPKIFHHFAKAKESDSDFEAAVEAYAKSGDVESCVRLLLDKLNQPQRAVAIVQETRSIEAAKLVAKFLEKLGDYASALKFLVVSRCAEDALRLCKEQGLVELYAQLVAEEAGQTEEGERQLVHLGTYFQQQGKQLLAAKCYYHAAHFAKALKNLIQFCKGNSADQEGIALGIEVVAASNDDSLANQFIELLLGEVDGEPRDPKHVFRLYKARKQYKEAAKTAVIIASEELVNGNYSIGHSVLVGMCLDLHDEGLPASSELTSLLCLLHSYKLVRLHVKHGDHLKAARMLLRVADNISKFPAHIVPILTSTVIECYRADLKTSAFNYAAMLMRPEYKSKIEAKYVKKMEGVVRKAPRGPDKKLIGDSPEDTSPCPYCSNPLIQTLLVCNKCTNSIPFCIATGWHIVKEDFTVCPNCQFPAIKSELIALIELGERCPMCQDPIESIALRIELDPEPYLFPHYDD